MLQRKNHSVNSRIYTGRNILKVANIGH